jgi:transcription elongation factor/antiterminator RfaH
MNTMNPMNPNSYNMRENQLKWYALHARSRHEDVVFDQLEKKSIEAFLPKIEVMSRRKDRRKRILVPLLPGYVFVNTDLNPYHYYDIIKTYGVVRLIGIQGKPVPVKEEEILSLQVLNGTDRTVRNRAYMKSGDRIMIMEGPLKGLVGFYLRHKGKSEKVVVSVELLHRSLTVEIENWSVEKIA